MTKSRRGRKPKTIALEPEQKQELERLSRRTRANRGVAFRAQIILLNAQGLAAAEVAKKLRTTLQTVYKWTKRFRAAGVDALYDEAKPGAPRKITDEKIESVVVQTLEKTPKESTHWSTRQMARKVGLSQSAISRIWRTFGLKPHRASTFTLCGLIESLALPRAVPLTQA